MTTHKQYLTVMRNMARKYKAMGLPVQRRNAVEDALFWRRVCRQPRN